MTSRIMPTVIAPSSTIGIVSPSSAVAAACPRRFARGRSNLEALGFATLVTCAATSRSSLGYTSANPIQRADDLNEMFADPRVDAVMTTIGGTAANHILDYLDLSVIAANPKFLIGYSDITLLQAALWHRLKMTSISGPALLPQFGEPQGLHRFTKESFLRIATKAEPPGRLSPSGIVVSDVRRWDIDDDEPRQERIVNGPRVLRSGHAAGWLAPVNLESILALTGTDWCPDLDGAMLVLEASEVTSAARFHQGLHQLKAQRVLERINGLALGRFDPRSECSPRVLNEIAQEVLGAGEYPIICDIDYGHTDPLLSLPWGPLAELHAEAGVDLAITEPAGAARMSIVA